MHFVSKRSFGDSCPLCASELESDFLFLPRLWNGKALTINKQYWWQKLWRLWQFASQQYKIILQQIWTTLLRDPTQWAQECITARSCHINFYFVLFLPQESWFVIHEHGLLVASYVMSAIMSLGMIGLSCGQHFGIALVSYTFYCRNAKLNLMLDYQL